MLLKRIFLPVALVALCVACAAAQHSPTAQQNQTPQQNQTAQRNQTPRQKQDKGVYLSPDAPKDAPTSVESEDARKLDEAIKPYVEKARKSYPDAKKRFLAGLPPKHTFFVTTRLHDDAGRSEQVFIAVKEIKDGRISGLIWSDIGNVSGYKHGDSYAFPESELLDWMIAKPDGTEEGNFVGKFLDTYNPNQN